MIRTERGRVGMRLSKCPSIQSERVGLPSWGKSLIMVFFAQTPPVWGRGPRKSQPINQRRWSNDVALSHHRRERAHSLLLRWLTRPGRSGDPRYAQDVLGWKATTSFEDLVTEIVRVDGTRVRTGIEESLENLTVGAPVPRVSG